MQPSNFRRRRSGSAGATPSPPCTATVHCMPYAVRWACPARLRQLRLRNGPRICRGVAKVGRLPASPTSCDSPSDASSVEGWITTDTIEAPHPVHAGILLDERSHTTVCTRNAPATAHIGKCHPPRGAPAIERSHPGAPAGRMREFILCLRDCGRQGAACEGHPREEKGCRQLT